MVGLLGEDPRIFPNKPYMMKWLYRFPVEPRTIFSSYGRQKAVQLDSIEALGYE